MTNSLEQSLMMGASLQTADSIVGRAQNPYYRKALLQDPNYDAAVELRGKALRMRLAHIDTRPKAVPMPTSVDDDLDQWLAAVTAALSADADWLDRDNALQRLIHECDARISGVGLDRDRILKSLDDDLADLMDNITTTVQRLNGADTPAEVIAAGVGDTWNELGSLRREYDLIRKAQDDAMVGASEFADARSRWLFDDPLASDTQFSNLDAVFPAWREPDPHASRRIRTPDERPQPWPTDSTAQLVWIVTVGAEAWIPTTGQLNALWTRRRASRAHNGQTPKQIVRPETLNKIGASRA